jgi:hypothetical protein
MGRSYHVCIIIFSSLCVRILIQRALATQCTQQYFYEQHCAGKYNVFKCGNCGLILITVRPCVSQTLTNAIAQKIIRGICASDDDQICCALSISKLSKNEVEQILKTIITNELFL